MAYLFIIINISGAMVNLFCFPRRGLDPLLLLSFLCLIFFAVPMWLSYYHGDVGEYAFNYGITPQQIRLVEVLFLQTLIIYIFILSLIIKPKSRYVKFSIRDRTIGANIFDLALVLIWCIAFQKIYAWWDGSLVGLLVFARKYFDIPRLPLILLTLLPTVLYVRSYNIKTHVYLKFIIAFFLIISTLITGQRRELLTAIMIIILIPLIFPKDGQKKLDRSQQVSSKTILLGMGVALLIPFSWYARGISTQFNKTGSLDLSALQARGFLELLGGSLTSGYQSFLAFSFYLEKGVIKFGDGILFLMTSVFPSFLFDSKFPAVPVIIGRFRDERGNLSSFFINDMYFSHPFLAFILVTLTLVFISMYYRYNLSVGIFVFCYVPYIFKNGFYQFFSLLFLFTLLYTTGCLANRIRLTRRMCK